MIEKREIKGVIFYDNWKIPMELLDAERFGKLVKSFLLWAWIGDEPADLDETQAMFFAIAKKKAKQDFEKYDAIVEKRREAGRKHYGNQYTRLEQNGTNGTSVPKMEQVGTNGTNGTSVPKMEQMEQVGTNGTNNNYNYNYNNNYNYNYNNNNNKEKEYKEKEYKEKDNTADKSATQKTIEERKNDFYNELVPFVYKYGKDMIRSFYNYWSQVNKGGRKMLWEMQKAFDISKRLATWHGKEYNGTGNKENELYRNSEERMEQAKKEGWI